MLIAGHQPNYLPYTGFFHKISLSDIFVIVDIVQYVKRGAFGWINRNRIRTADGWLWLTVPVKTKDRFYQSIKGTEIDNSRPWAQKHLKSIERNYHNAPYFSKHFGFFSDIYGKQWDSLAGLNEAIIRYIIKALGINIRIVRASELDINYALPSPGARNDNSATDLIVQMCQKLDSDSYLHGKHASDYLDEDGLKQYNIKSYYQDFRHPVYPQVYEPFMPDMSIIDLLFNCGDKSMKIIRQSGGKVSK